MSAERALQPFDKDIYVTRPLLPPLEAVQARLAEVWDAQWLTNAGRQHELLREAVRRYLDVPHLSLFNNGTIALLAAVRALGIRGGEVEVITTPFTFPATPHAISWSGATPVFVDIDPRTMTIDPEAVEAAVTSKTRAILGVHVYGIPCHVKELQAIADRFGLKVIYDAAHAFGTRVNGQAIGTFGDASMFSFHATKLFHTAEGGALSCNNQEILDAVEQLKNFGIVNQEKVNVAGINGKMNELQAALGLAVLDLVPGELQRRKAIIDRYQERLSELPGLRVIREGDGVQSSNQYCVIRIDRLKFGCSRDLLHKKLQDYRVITRKYFFPLCTDYACYAEMPGAAPGLLPVAEAVVQEVLCLPLYGTLSLEDVDRICDMIRHIRQNA